MAMMKGAAEKAIRAALGNRSQKPTPLELDVQLQIAELSCRAQLEAKRLNVTLPEDLDGWYKQQLGEAWFERNLLQRAEMKRLREEEGEGTPMWIEARTHMSDLALEVFEPGISGERMRKLGAIDRREVIGEFNDVRAKVKLSFYAKCGAGFQLVGFRASIAVLRLFIRDAEVLESTADCLLACIRDHQYNCEGLTAVTLPVPPAEREEGHVERGWSFLRAALDAILVQSGVAEPFQSPSAPSREKEEDDEEEAESSPGVSSIRLEVAVKLADLLLTARAGRPLRAQLGLLREPLPADAVQDRRELHEMLPDAHAKLVELTSRCKEKALVQLTALLSWVSKAG